VCKYHRKNGEEFVSHLETNITRPQPQTYKIIKNLNHSSSSFPILGILRPVTGVTKLNPSIFSKVFLNFFSLLVGILEFRT
jgi:hypothetical protein